MRSACLARSLPFLAEARCSAENNSTCDAFLHQRTLGFYFGMLRFWSRSKQVVVRDHISKALQKFLVLVSNQQHHACAEMPGVARLLSHLFRSALLLTTFALRSLVTQPYVDARPLLIERTRGQSPHTARYQEWDLAHESRSKPQSDDNAFSSAISGASLFTQSRMLYQQDPRWLHSQMEFGVFPVARLMACTITSVSLRGRHSKIHA